MNRATSMQMTNNEILSECLLGSLTFFNFETFRDCSRYKTFQILKIQKCLKKTIKSEAGNTLHAAESVNIRELAEDILIIQKKNNALQSESH